MGAQRGQATVWTPKPVKVPAYQAPMRPHVKLADLRARHRQDASWRELLVDDGRSRGEYVQDAPGTKVPPRFHPDTRQFWAVMDGQLRVEIEGQEPFVATKGSVVNVPKQTLYAMETIGDRPSLRFEVNVSEVKTLHPVADGVKPPAPLPGYAWTQAAYSRRPATYDAPNLPHVNLFEVVNGRTRFTQNVVRDPHHEVLFIYGLEKELGPLAPDDRGHFHPESAEFWVVMTGQISYLIEGQPLFVADEGDVVYAPPMTYHRARFHGDAPACRLSITEFQGNSQLVER
jgi:quercetin dioxygenase-like cupin family protein